MAYMNLKNLQRELGRVQRRAVDLETKIKSKMKDQYSSLPTRVGLKSIDHLIEALKPYASAKYRGGDGSSASGSQHSGNSHSLGSSHHSGRGHSQQSQRSNAPAARKNARGSSRVRYGVDVKDAIKRELQKGGKTYGQLSEQYGPSVFSIKDWKKSWGLTKPRAKKKAA